MIRSLLLISSLGLMAKASGSPDAGGSSGADGAGPGPGADAPPPPPQPKAKAKRIKVKVIAAALGEGDETYLKGDTFETSEERAAALGDSIEVLS